MNACVASFAVSCRTRDLLEKPSMAFPTSPFEKRGFQMAPIFNGLQPSKMPAHPCAARSLLKNRVFQQAARMNQWVEILSKASDVEETILYANIEHARTKEVRDIWPFLRDRRIEAYACLLKRYCD